MGRSFFFSFDSKKGELIEQCVFRCVSLFEGNGASTAISIHMAIDNLKNGGIRGVAFDDSSLLTCISNDYGYKHLFERVLEMFADEGDLWMAISSFGNS